MLGIIHRHYNMFFRNRRFYMFKTGTKLFYLFISIALLFPIAVSGQTPEPDTSEHFAVYLDAGDRVLITDPNMDRWLGHLDDCYDRLYELTGNVPYSGAIIEIRPTDEDFGGDAYAGNPIMWHRPKIANALVNINANDDWCWTIIHEISHDFDQDMNWEFHSEVLGTFKTLYIFDCFKNQYPYAADQLREKKEFFLTDFNGNNSAFADHGIVRGSIEYWLNYIQGQTGWQPFIDTFNYMRTMNNPPQTDLAQFMAFRLFLDTFSSEDVMSMIPSDQLKHIQHFLEKGEMCIWKENEFIQKTRIKATTDIPSGQVKLVWNDYLNNEDGYEIEYSVNDGEYAYLAEAGLNATQYTTSNLPPNDTYKFRIRAYNTSQYIAYRAYSYFSNEAVPDNVASFKPAFGDGVSDIHSVDGNDSTACGMINQEPHLLVIDLQGLEAVDKFVVKHAEAMGFPDYHNTKDFQIQTSIDGQNWDVVETVVGNTEAITTRTLDVPVYASYVRLNITKASQTSETTALICEFEIYRTTDPEALTNVALNKAVTDDNNHGIEEGPEKAVDGTIENNSKWCAQGTAAHFLTVNLEQNTNISYIVIKHAGLFEDESYNTKGFTVKCGLDDSSWDTIQPVIDIDDNTSNISIFDFGTPVTARYIRLDITQATQTTETNARIYELEAWGEESSGPSGVVTILYENHETATTTNTIRSYFKVKNEGTSTLDLSDVTIRYWYTREGTANQSAVCDYAGLNNNNITSFVNASILPAVPAASGANYYLEIGFDSGAGSLAPGQQTNEIQIRFNKTDWSNYTQTGDYSFNASMTTFSANTAITGYIDGVLSFGNTPQ